MYRRSLISGVRSVSSNRTSGSKSLFESVFRDNDLIDLREHIRDELELLAQLGRLLMSASIVIRIMLKGESAFMAEKALRSHFVEHLHNCPFRLASGTEIFLSFVRSHSLTLDGFIDEVDSPL